MTLQTPPAAAARLAILVDSDLRSLAVCDFQKSSLGRGSLTRQSSRCTVADGKPCPMVAHRLETTEKQTRPAAMDVVHQLS
jgi:hypothetical protein